METLDDTPDGEVLDAPVKPGSVRIILADSQAIYRVGIRKVFALEDDLRVVAQADSWQRGSGTANQCSCPRRGLAQSAVRAAVRRLAHR